MTDDPTTTREKLLAAIDAMAAAGSRDPDSVDPAAVAGALRTLAVIQSGDHLQEAREQTRLLEAIRIEIHTLRHEIDGLRSAIWTDREKRQ